MVGITVSEVGLTVPLSVSVTAYTIQSSGPMSRWLWCGPGGPASCGTGFQPVKSRAGSPCHTFENPRHAPAQAIHCPRAGSAEVRRIAFVVVKSVDRRYHQVGAIRGFLERTGKGRGKDHLCCTLCPPRPVRRRNYRTGRRRCALKLQGLVPALTSLAFGSAAVGGEGQPPKGEAGLSFRSETSFVAADDFLRDTDDPIDCVRWWGSFADEAEPGDHTTGQFRISFHRSAGGVPVDPAIAKYTVEADETYTGGSCRGIEGLGGNKRCPGPEPLYLYEACLDPPFVAVANTEYWLGIVHLLNNEDRFWAWHEADVVHPTRNEAATWSSFGGWKPGMINACPGDFLSKVGPYDLAYEIVGGSKCNYTIRKSKAKGGCRSCPGKGEGYESEAGCQEKKDCRKKLKTTINCPQGNGRCKLKAKKRRCK